jgi:carbohydrate-selective porin OprB
MFFFAPPYNNIISFYFQAGLVYQGLVPKRKHDNLSIAYGNGTYSKKFANTQRTPTNQAILEMNYDIAITKWLNFRPFYQLLINPASDKTVRNAHVLGFTVFAIF